jgi:hypothetical protein
MKMGKFCGNRMRDGADKKGQQHVHSNLKYSLYKISTINDKIKSVKIKKIIITLIHNKKTYD